MKTNADIIIDGLLARVRELESSVADRDFTLKAVGRFIKDSDINQLDGEQSKAFVRNFNGYTFDLPSAGGFEDVETHPNDFDSLIKFMLDD